jgi:hypothetical protein
MYQEDLSGKVYTEAYRLHYSFYMDIRLTLDVKERISSYAMEDK